MEEGTADRSRAPRDRKEGDYELTNAYTQPVACEQVLTLVLFLGQLALHSVFAIPAIIDHGHPVLWDLAGIQHGLLIVIIYDYCYLTMTDPVDELILSPETASQYGVFEVRMCPICDRQVRKTSYHCMRCNRCTDDFDHHCKFLNNCIGSKNYENFFRLSLINSLYNAVILAQVIWLLVFTFDHRQLSFEGSEWGLLILAVLTFVFLLFVASLTIFHAYLTCEGTSTYNLIFAKKREKESGSSPRKAPSQLPSWDTPRSARRISQASSHN